MYPDASFDIVSSSFGVMFEPDQRAAAAELTRVCRPGGRMALLTWHPSRGVAELFKVILRLSSVTMAFTRSKLSVRSSSHQRRAATASPARRADRKRRSFS